MTASQLMPPSLSGASDHHLDVAAADGEVASSVNITVSSIDDLGSKVLGGGANYVVDVVVVHELSESPAVFMNTRLPSDTTDDDFTPDEWQEVKQQVLAKICANALDTPESHLSYVREQLALANAHYV